MAPHAIAGSLGEQRLGRSEAPVSLQSGPTHVMTVRHGRGSTHGWSSKGQIRDGPAVLPTRSRPYPVACRNQPVEEILNVPPSKDPKPYTIGEPFDISVLKKAKPARAASTRDVVLERPSCRRRPPLSPRSFGSSSTRRRTRLR